MAQILMFMTQILLFQFLVTLVCVMTTVSQETCSLQLLSDLFLPFLVGRSGTEGVGTMSLQLCLPPSESGCADEGGEVWIRSDGASNTWFWFAVVVF